MSVPLDSQDYRGSHNLNEEYEREKKEGETYEEWVARKSDNETTKFFIFLIVGVPIALLLIGLIGALFGD